MADCLRGSERPSGKLGPLLIDIAHERALEQLVGDAAMAQADLTERHETSVAFDEQGVRALDRILAVLRANRPQPGSPAFVESVRAIGAVLTVVMLKHGDSIIAFRAKDSGTNTSLFVGQAKAEYFPFHQVHKCLAGEGSLEGYWRGFVKDSGRG